MRAPSQEPPVKQEPAQQAPMKIGALDVEEFSRNLARLVEEGGRALAAYLKPREEGRDRRRTRRRDRPKSSRRSARSRNTGWPIRSAPSNCRPGSARPISICGRRRQSGSPAKRRRRSSRPAPSDKRFADPEWTQNQFFDFLKQAYLLTAHWADKLVNDAADLDPHTRQKAEFYVRQITNALSPTNFVLTNPELLRETLTSNADNLVRGMHMLAEDIEAGGGDLKIRQSDASMFEVGRNLAITPGKVIFQNELMQLIQYAPSTETVLKRPLLIVPPWINKYLRARSDAGKILHQMVRRSGHHRVLHFLGQSGRRSSPRRASRTMCGKGRSPRSTPSSRRPARTRSTPSAIASAARCWRSRSRRWRPGSDERIVSATLFAAQVDFTYAGDLKVFVDEEQVAALEQRMAERGYLEGRSMATVFNMLRSNDLIWPYVINNYLQGQGAVSVRPAVLEFRRHPPAGRQSLVLSAQLLSRQQAVEGQDDDRQHADRSQGGQGADLQSGDARGPYRAGEIGDARLEIFRRRR